MMTTTAEQLQSNKPFFSLYKEACALFSSLLKPGDQAADSRCAVPVAAAYDLVPELPHGQSFDPANCYIFKRVNLSV